MCEIEVDQDVGRLRGPVSLITIARENNEKLADDWFLIDKTPLIPSGHRPMNIHFL